MNSLPEFAEEYSNAERLRFVVTGGIVGAVLIAASRVWLLPWLGAFAASASCREVLGIDGVSLLWYAAFVGIPLFAAAVVGMTVGYRGYRVLREGRAPPRGAKVFRRTRIKRGTAAKLVGYAHVCAFLPLLGLAFWGCFQAARQSEPSRPERIVCTAHHSIERTSHEELRRAVP